MGSYSEKKKLMERVIIMLFTEENIKPYYQIFHHVLLIFIQGESKFPLNIYQQIKECNFLLLYNSVLLQGEGEEA